MAVALPGAVLPDGTELAEVKLRGETSSGMILSERELDLGADHSGIMVLEDGPEPGTPLADVLPLSEQVLEIETTPNRPDLLSIYGVAREVAAIFGGELRPMPGTDPDRVADEPVDIRIEDLERCPRYVGRTFRDVRIGPSPTWLKARLIAAGMRPISNVVDATNYVMLALGSPLHAFDQSKLAEGRIVVRRAHPDEEIRTLDGTVRTLTTEDLVIADAERPVAIAGVMGGEDSEVTEETTDVLLEAANFEPSGIQRTSERLGLRSEASGRWEKGVDPHLAEDAARLCSQLFAELAGAGWTGESDVSAELPEPAVIHLRPERASALLGLEVEPDEQRQVLEALGFEVSGDWNVTVPTWRARDVTREVDLIEEVGRMKLDEVPFTLPVRAGDVRPAHSLAAAAARRRGRPRRARLLRGVHAQPRGRRPGPGRLSDPAAPVAGHGRAAHDAPSRASSRSRATTSTSGTSGIALFEIAHVYRPSDGELPDERVHVAGLAQAPYARAKGAVEEILAAGRAVGTFARGEHPLLHPGQTATTTGGILGGLRPGILEGEWSAFELDLGALDVEPGWTYEDVITYPPLKQDLAFAVPDEVLATDLVEAARAAVPELRSMEPFDVYRGDQVGEGRKSIAFRVEFRSPERTLTDEEAAGLREKIVAALGERFGAELRA